MARAVPPVVLSVVLTCLVMARAVPPIALSVVLTCLAMARAVPPVVWWLAHLFSDGVGCPTYSIECSSHLFSDGAGCLSVVSGE